ncbi:MAG: replication-associated recombination protein A [Thermoanaerobaculia bacterium]|jgi:putative ATPase|nr:replication-associated recombination protein A [Thermoanaerobaculia bacterium]MBP9823076.1 replication-associated recombination protein A [Thermoanaerobaculia bacterium]
MRPRTLDEVAGHTELLGPRGFLRRAIAEDRVPSLLFWGPPGCGKTTLARLIAESTKSRFVPFSAVTSGIKEIKEVMSDAVKMRTATGRRTILFVDEIHRFNRAQQDAFLPYVERGDIVLVGATTENPSFELNAALLSRCKVVMLQALGPEELAAMLRRALTEPLRGLGASGIEIGDEALGTITQLAGGDGRRALGLLELAVSEAVGAGLPAVTVDGVAQLAQRKVLLYDKSGEEHFNLISALHKSLRESDPDAALYWLGRMLAAGEDPNYLARRLVRFASEDIGLADPQALPQALAGWASYERLGSPEGEVALAQVAIYLALAPKSIAVYRAYGDVRRAIEERPAEPVPLALRNAPTKLMKGLGYGRDYAYAPDTREGVAGLECLPDDLAGTTFYRPSGKGFEAKLSERLEEFARRRLAARERAGS